MKKISYNSPVILTFAILSLAVLGLAWLTNNKSNLAFFSVYSSSIKDWQAWVRLFGHVLGHANMAHYTNNMLLLLMVGPILEEKYGSLRMLAMIAFTAVVTGLVHILISDTVLLGASGIVFMLILLSSVTNIRKGTLPLTLIFAVIIYIGKEIIAGVSLTDNTSQLAHIFGGICGVFLGVVTSNDKTDNKFILD